MIYFFCLLLMIQVSTEARRNAYRLQRCHQINCPPQQFSCLCESADWRYQACIPQSWVCDGWADCSDSSDEIDCICPNNSFQCGCDHGGGCSSMDDMYYCIPQNKSCNGKIDCLSGRDELSCNGTNLHQCLSGEYIEPASACDGRINCKDGYSDEVNCTSCPKKLPNRCECNRINNMTCRGYNAFICHVDGVRCNGWNSCPDNSDETYCSDCPIAQPHRCDCNRPGNNTCEGVFSCYRDYDRCNGRKDCSDNSDEKLCSDCPSNRPHRCDCNQPGNNTCGREFSCYRNDDICDGISVCEDGSDERRCWEKCSENEFACKCLRKNSATCSSRQGCVSKFQFRDGNIPCPFDNNEASSYTTMDCGSCRIIAQRLSSKEECSKIGIPLCDNSTCYSIPSVKCLTRNCTNEEVLCSSHCPNTTKTCKPYQCADGNIISFQEFCDFKSNCKDDSDEIRTQYGFKCSFNDDCVLPQIFVNDNFPHCSNEADLCGKPGNCFECYDKKHIISSMQVCDGVINCYDLSDECLCKNTFDSDICKSKFALNDPFSLQCIEDNNLCNRVSGTLVNEARCSISETFMDQESSISCKTKWRNITPVLCDGRPECSDFSDECTSECIIIAPSYCNDTCHSFYPLGDRYCDGKNDSAWKFINDSIRCPEGFDEKNCPKRFVCQAGELMSIDVSKVCDGTADCDNGEDETYCHNSNNQERAFSSETEMIASVPLKATVWIIGFLSILGNTWAIQSVTQTLVRAPADMSDMIKFSNILLLNLSCSDLLMGIYLLTIAIKSVIYSGNYGQFDFEWRSSTTCSVIGSLQLLSSETSCFLMTIMTAFRLYNVRNPFIAITGSATKWKLFICVAWLFAFLLSFSPLLPITSVYFTHAVWTSDLSSNSTEWKKDDTIALACRLATLKNKLIPNKENVWESTKDFLQSEFHEYNIKGEFGYYGENSVCMPRFYVKHLDYAWEYSITLMTINFIAFFCMMIGYIWLLETAKNVKIETSNDRTKQNKKMQRKIASLVITDFMCWMPICIMAYLKFAGVYLSMEVYVVSAIVVLPINSAMNPLLYTNILEIIVEKFPFAAKKKLEQSNNTSE